MGVPRKIAANVVQRVSLLSKMGQCCAIGDNPDNIKSSWFFKTTSEKQTVIGAHHQFANLPAIRLSTFENNRLTLSFYNDPSTALETWNQWKMRASDHLSRLISLCSAFSQSAVYPADSRKSIFSEIIALCAFYEIFSCIVTFIHFPCIHYCFKKQKKSLYVVLSHCLPWPQCPLELYRRNSYQIAPRKSQRAVLRGIDHRSNMRSFGISDLPILIPVR